jgi:hypothetical protein
MANSTMPLIGLLAVGGLAYYRFSEGEATTDSSTTSSTTTGSTTTDSTTETTDSDSDVNYVDEWIDPPIYSSNSDFKRFMQGEVDELHNPFSIHRLMGKTKWLSDSKVELIDYDWSDSKSGGIDIQIAQGSVERRRVQLSVDTPPHALLGIDRSGCEGGAKEGDRGQTYREPAQKRDIHGGTGVIGV